MTSHVGANSHVEFWRRSQPKMGIEAYDGVDLLIGIFRR